MRQKFAFNLFILFTANLLVKPYWIFGIDRVVQNKVGPDVYGTYFAVFNYSFIFSMLLDFGINNFNNRAVSRNNTRMGEYLFNLLIIKTVLSVIYLVVTFISAVATGFSGDQMSMLLFLAINQVLLSVILYFRSNIAAIQMFKTDSVISVLDRLLTIIFCLVLLYAPAFKQRFNIMWFIYAQTASLFITALACVPIVAMRSKIKLQIWKGKFTRLILLKSVPFALLTLLMGIYYRIDAVMISQMIPGDRGSYETGVYAASFRLLDAVNMFGFLFATLLLPLFANMIRKREDLKPLVKFSAELMFACSIGIAVICYFFRAEMMTLLYKNSNPYWYSIFGWLMINFIPISSIYVFGTLLTANGNLKILNLIAVVGVVINVGLNLFLIPAYGALGATIATLITQIIVAAVHIWAANRTFNFRYNPMVILRMGSFAVLTTLSVYLLKYIPIPWQLLVVIAGGICALLSFALQIIPMQDVRDFAANFKRSRA